MTKGIHYSTDLEKAILGAILLETTAFGRVYGILEPSVFYHTRHQIFFSTFQEMWENNEPVDLETAFIKLARKGYDEFKHDHDNVPYLLTTLTSAVVSTANLEYHSLLLRQMYVEREMLSITQSGLNGKEGMEYIKELQERLVKLQQVKATNDFKSTDEILIDLYNHMDKVKDKTLSGIPTGFEELDKTTGGLESGGMYIVAARPSVGKSAFMGQMVLNAAIKGHKVAVISLEMEDKKIMARIASIVSDVEFWRIYRNRMFDDNQADKFYRDINEKLSHLPIKISDNPAVNIGDIKAKVARLKQRGEADIVFIDYLGLIDTEGGNKNHNREQEVSKISRGVKLMAMQYEIPVVLLCQLNRASEQSHEKKPKLHNLRESGSLEQDADGVIFIHRDFMSGVKEIDGRSTENEADIIVAKWRNGELLDLKVGFDGTKMKFYEFQTEGNWKPVKQLEDNPF